jgi:dTDP-4-amino-4,6-dideoxygalactose transaminase
MSNIVAGIGRGQMKVLTDRIAARRKMHDFYVALFKDIEGVYVFTKPSADFYANHWLSAIIVDANKTGKTREDLRLALLEHNIESRPLCKPMHLQPIFANAPYYGTNVSEKLFDDGLCMPSGSNLTVEERQRIALKIKEVISKIIKTERIISVGF